MKKLMLKNMLLLFPPATLSEEWLRDLYLIFYNPLFTTCLKNWYLIIKHVDNMQFS